MTFPTNVHPVPPKLNGRMGKTVKMYHAIAQQKSKHSIFILFVHDRFRGFWQYIFHCLRTRLNMHEWRAHISMFLTHTIAPWPRSVRGRTRERVCLTGAWKPVRYISGLRYALLQVNHIFRVGLSTPGMAPALTCQSNAHNYINAVRVQSDS